MTIRTENGASQPVVWKGRHVWLRRLRGDDQKRYAAFYAALDPARFDRLMETGIPDPDAFAGTLGKDDGDILFGAIVNDESDGSVLGVARARRIADEDRAEIAIVLRPSVEGQGLGRLLMGRLVNYCRDHGISELVGQASFANRRMIDLAHAYRFVEAPGAVSGVVSLRLQLQRSADVEE